MTERNAEREASAADLLDGAPRDLSVEVDRRPLIPLHPPHFTPQARIGNVARTLTAPPQTEPGFAPLEPGPRPTGRAHERKPGAKKKRSRRFSWLTRLLIILITPLLLLGAVAVGAAFYLQHQLNSHIDRFPDPFVVIPAAERPAAVAGDAQNILLLGSDSRISAGDPAKWQAGSQRTDAIMILHITAARDAAYVTSIPRDSWVSIPGHGQNKINAAFSFGGPALTVLTVERLTGVRIDHVMIADFEGFRDLTDAIGGVTITVPEASGVKGANVLAGKQKMDGATALLYVRERYHLPGGDFDRVQRQQNWIRAIASQTLSAGMMKHPKELYNVLSTFTRLIQVDEGFSIGDMRSLGFSMRSLASGDLHFLTAPVSGTGRSPDGKQSIVNLAPSADKELFKYMAQDHMDFWAAKHYDELLGTKVR